MTPVRSLLPGVGLIGLVMSIPAIATDAPGRLQFLAQEASQGPAGELPATAESSPPPVTGSGSRVAGWEANPASPAAFEAFANFAVAEAEKSDFIVNRLSVLIDVESLFSTPHRMTCGNRPNAVAIDLDPGKGVFNPDDPPSPAPGLAQALTRIRSAGITVFWTSALRDEQSEKVYTVIRAAGLDDAGADQVLLVRKTDLSKQARRMAAARDWCFVALAGDAKGDFEEALDYLREPEGPIAQTLEPMFGAGWFRTPNPID